MAIYQCFFFSEGRVGYWENIECDEKMLRPAALKDRLKNGKWNHAEAWSDGKLVCEVHRRRSSNEDASKFTVESLCSELREIASNYLLGRRASARSRLWLCVSRR